MFPPMSLDSAWLLSGARRLGVFATFVLLAACSGDSRTQVRIVGSSTVYPFTAAVAEQFKRTWPQFDAPIVEATGTGGGIKLFCAGVGQQYPDVANASRRIKASEVADCARHGASFAPSASGSQPRERPPTRRTEHSVTRLEPTRSAPTLPAAARDAPTTPAPPLRAVPASSMAARRPSQVALTVPVPAPMQAPMEATSGSRAALSRAHIA